MKKLWFLPASWAQKLMDEAPAPLEKLSFTPTALIIESSIPRIAPFAFACSLAAGKNG